jgi:hypothetical protein
MPQNMGQEYGDMGPGLSPPLKGSLGSGGIRAGIVTHAPAGYSETVYQPLGGLQHQPPLGDDRHRKVSPGIAGFGDGGGIVLPQYRAHKDVKVYHSPVQQWAWRSDPEPYSYQYPARRRTLIARQVPQKYIIGNTLVASTVWGPQNYFLGYAPNGTT